VKYLILGDGYIGNYLYRNLPHATLIRNKIFDAKTLRALITELYPSHVLINCAGKTGRPNVDACEFNKDVVFGANVGLPVMIAEAMRELKTYWVHIGSGCVYDGYDKDYDEDDEPNFLGSFYARTKKWSQDILEDFDEVLTLRIRMPIDELMNERCYIRKVVEYAMKGYKIFDLQNSMTYLKDLSDAIFHLTELGSTGTYNVVNRGSLSPVDVVEMWKRQVEDFQYQIASYEEVRKSLRADRSNCILSVDKLLGEGFRMPTIIERVQEVLDRARPNGRG